MSSKVTRTIRVMVPLLIFSASMLRSQTASSASTSTQNGVYTAEQSQQGKSLYGKQCAACHQNSLEGKGQNPPLVGEDFLKDWEGQTMADLYDMTHSTMPATSPGSLSPAETVQVLAYILNANGFPSGATALPTDPDRLKAIHIVAPQKKP